MTDAQYDWLETFRPDWAGRGAKVLFAMWLVLSAAVSFAATDMTTTNAATTSTDASSSVLPAWMELSALATNAAPWADLAAIWRQPDPESSPVEDFTLPVEHYDNGRIRAVLRANKAAVGKAGLIWSWHVIVDMFDPLGKPDGRITADSCLYDRNARRGYCPAAVVLSLTNVTIHGTGMYWVMSTQQMQIMSNLVVRLPQNTQLHGLALPTAEPAQSGKKKKPVDAGALRGDTTK